MTVTELKELDMRSMLRWLLAMVVCGFSFLKPVAQDCPARPVSGTVVADPYSITSVNGTLTAKFSLGHSVDSAGYTHYCERYQAPKEVVESPTLRVNPGDVLDLNVIDGIKNTGDEMKMDMALPTGQTCGDGGLPTINSTNMHFHGMNVPPVCHQDDVINTLIQPGSPGFQFSVHIPTYQPPGLYWYHPHVHGFTEFQVNGGAAGALIVEGMEKVRPEVAGLTERVFVIRQQYLVPWVPGPYELTVNYQVAPNLGTVRPIINMKPGEKQFWRVANATIQDFLQLQIQENDTLQPMELVALDGYPLAHTRNETTILIPPAGRAEFIVQAPAAGGSATLFTSAYNTGPTGNLDVSETLANIETSTNTTGTQMPKPTAPASGDGTKFFGLAQQPATIQRKLYFSEEFGGTNGPIQFYITMDGQKQRVFEPNEQPVIKTKVGAIEDWTIENRALETHAFHIHQIHFRVLEIDGKPVTNQDLRDTIEIPYWEGKGPYHSVKVRMDFSDPTTAGTFLFHCHILLHEDLGMMHKILVEP